MYMYLLVHALLILAISFQFHDDVINYLCPNPNAGFANKSGKNQFNLRNRYYNTTIH